MIRPCPVALAVAVLATAAATVAAPAPHPAPTAAEHAARAAAKRAARVAAKAQKAEQAAFARLLCVDKPRCSVTEVADGGHDTAGRALHVVTVRLDDPDPDGEMDGCAQAEHWLVTGSAAAPAARQLLASGYAGLCGAVGDNASTSPGTFQFEDFCGGGHPDHYDHTYTLSLSPLGYASEDGSDAERFPGTNIVDYAWSWLTFSGTGKATYFRCDAHGDPLGENEPTGPEVSWVTLPALPSLPAGAASAHLGGCAAYVDGSSGGFTIHGTPGTAADAQLRAVIAGRTLLVEVTDDHWVGPGADWTYDDHLELWLSPTASPQQLDQCEDLGARGAQQWGVRIAGGAVFAAWGHPADTLVVKRTPTTPGAPRDGQPVRLAITLPRWFHAETSGITVVYSDSDDGKTQKRLIATSELALGKRWTIGRARVIRPIEATCAVRGGRLEPVRNRRFRPGTGMIDQLLAP